MAIIVIKATTKSKKGEAFISTDGHKSGVLFGDIVDLVARITSGLNGKRSRELRNGSIADWVGIQLSKNFAREGQAGFVRPWQSLSEMTRNVRMERGYPGYGPILVQSGALKSAALAGFKSGSTGTYSAGGVSAAWNLTGNTLRWTIDGEKVENNWGGFMKGKSGKRAAIGSTGKVGRYGSGFLPSRPFFFITDDIAMGAAKLACDTIIESAFSSSGGGE